MSHDDHGHDDHGPAGGHGEGRSGHEEHKGGLGRYDNAGKIKDFGFEEEIAEDFKVEDIGGYVKTGFPKPLRRLKLVYESERVSMEESYFWVFNHLTLDWGFGDVVKTVDTLGASSHSSIWGLVEQRKGIQQDRASQYLQTIGKMIQDLFKIVREIRILKERLALYDGVKKGRQADDIALKGYWVDMVEGGTKGQSNIYTMAQQLGFGTLPDLFFGIFVKDEKDIDHVVEEKAKEFNEKVKEVLKRKLATYMAWRKHTEDELRNRERFTLRYLRQHWAIIRMYINWVKPYLRNVQHLETPDKYHTDPELVGSFEGALMEIEFVARRAPKKKGKPAPTILASFYYRVTPHMDFHAEGHQHKGPVHVGRMEFALRCYGWNDDDVAAYVRYREQETMELIGMVDQSVRDALDALGDELMRYLKEAGEDVKISSKHDEKEKKEEKKSNSLLEPFMALGQGFKEMFSFGGDSFKDLIPKAKPKEHARGDMSQAQKAHKFMYLTYKNYKKNHGPMVNW